MFCFFIEDMVLLNIVDQQSAIDILPLLNTTTKCEWYNYL